MAQETRARSLTRVESLFAVDVPVEQKQQSLVDMQRMERPDRDTIAAVVPILNDDDLSLRLMAQQSLSHWGQEAVTMILQALRSTAPQDVPYRLAIIEQLQRMGPTAIRAETLLRSLFEDKDVGEAAQAAVRAIRLDGADLTGRLIHTFTEVFFISLVVAGPLVALRLALPAKELPPLGLVIGMASLAVVGIMLARIAYAGDVIHQPNQPDTTPVRWSLYAMLALTGTVIGSAIAVLCWATGGVVQGWFK
jgi:hypothetical protein